MSSSGPCKKSLGWAPPIPRRYVINVPCNSINPTSTGVRRKLIYEDYPTSRRDLGQDCQPAEHLYNQPCDECDLEEEPFQDYNYRPSSSYYYNPNFTQNVNLERLRNLIDEENKRIVSSEELARSIGGSLKRPKTFKEANDAKEEVHTDMAFDVDSDIETSIPAAILGAEAQGIPFGQTHPSRFYGRLFPEDRERPTVQVQAASRKKGDKVMPKMTGIWREKELEYDLDAGIIDFYGMKKLKKPQETPKPAAHEPGENINELFGISTSEVMDERNKSFKYEVNRESKHRGNFLQLRGSENPSWFPGYMHVMPGQNTVQYTEEPFDILDKAWRSLSPSDVNSPHGNFIIGT